MGWNRQSALCKVQLFKYFKMWMWEQKPIWIMAFLHAWWSLAYQLAISNEHVAQGTCYSNKHNHRGLRIFQTNVLKNDFQSCFWNWKHWMFLCECECHWVQLKLTIWIGRWFSTFCVITKITELYSWISTIVETCVS
jgi:hypothetical protein